MCFTTDTMRCSMNSIVDPYAYDRIHFQSMSGRCHPQRGLTTTSSRTKPHSYSSITIQRRLSDTYLIPCGLSSFPKILTVHLACCLTLVLQPVPKALQLTYHLLISDSAIKSAAATKNYPVHSMSMLLVNISISFTTVAVHAPTNMENTPGNPETYPNCLN